MTSRGKITIALASLIILVNSLSLGASLIAGEAGDWLGDVGRILLAVWVVLLAVRIELEHERALTAERHVTYLRERIEIMER